MKSNINCQIMNEIEHHWDEICIISFQWKVWSVRGNYPHTSHMTEGLCSSRLCFWLPRVPAHTTPHNLHLTLAWTFWKWALILSPLTNSRPHSEQTLECSSDCPCFCLWCLTKKLSNLTHLLCSSIKQSVSLSPEAVVKSCKTSVTVGLIAPIGSGDESTKETQKKGNN